MSKNNSYGMASSHTQNARGLLPVFSSHPHTLQLAFNATLLEKQN